MSTETRHLTLIAIMCALLGAAVFTGALKLVGMARGDAPELVDAGPPDPVVVADHAAPTPPPVVAAPAIKDPVADPGGFAKDVQTTFRAGQWFMLAILGLFGLSRLLLWAAAKWSIAWLKRYAPVLVTASGLLAAVGATVSAGGTFDWQAVAGALFAAAALYLRPEPKRAAS